MQAVAVILALAVLAGCDARAVQPTATENWEVGINNFMDKMLALSQQTNTMVQSIQTSQLRVELDTVISDSMAKLAKYKDDFQTKIRSFTEGPTAQMTEDMQLLVDRLSRDLESGKEHGIQYLMDMQAVVEQNADSVQSRMQGYLKRLKRRLHVDTEEIRGTVATYLSELQSRASQNLDTARGQVEPYIPDSIDTEKLTQVSSILRTQAEGLGQQLETQAEALKAQLESTGQEISTYFAGMMDRLNDELPSIATQVREKLEEIVEKVKETASA